MIRRGKMDSEIKSMERALNNLIDFGVYNAAPVYKNPGPKTDRNEFEDIKTCLKQITQLKEELKKEKEYVSKLLDIIKSKRVKR